MAEVVTIEGEQYKKRSPWGAWGLSFITIGIYGIVWYYKINDEARRYLRDNTIRPGVSVLAIVPGFLLLVPPFVSVYRTGQRIVRMEDKTRIQRVVEPILGLLASVFYSLHIPYLQGHLNQVWDSAQASAPSQPPAPEFPPEIPPAPPAPPPGTP